MAQLAVAAVGSLFGGSQVGWLVGSFIGSQLFAEKQKIEGRALAIFRSRLPLRHGHPGRCSGPCTLRATSSG
jgi:hypothetical protein